MKDHGELIILGWNSNRRSPMDCLTWAEDMHGDWDIGLWQEWSATVLTPMVSDQRNTLHALIR